MKIPEFNRQTFRVIFRAVYAVGISIWATSYLWAVTFPGQGTRISKYAEFIVGFILGTLVATIISFYYGGADNGKNEERELPGPAGGIALSSTAGLPDAGAEVIPGDES